MYEQWLAEIRHKLERDEVTNEDIKQLLVELEDRQARLEEVHRIAMRLVKSDEYWSGKEDTETRAELHSYRP